jgi:hypothetical protein
VVAIEFQDEAADGRVEPGESFRLICDRPLPLDIDPSRVRVVPTTTASWGWEVRRLPGFDRVLELRVESGSPGFVIEGEHGRHPGATAFTVDLGDGEEQTVDVQPARHLPRLIRCVWEDRPPGAGNGVVDHGDWIRLAHDRDVKLAQGAEGAPVRVPGDVILVRPEDQLDDGAEPSRFRPSDASEEVVIVLGSAPRLTPSPGATARGATSTGSLLALNGTSVLPMPRITAAGGGPGAVSQGEVEIQFPEDFLLPGGRRGESLPPPGSRILHTLTPLDGVAVIAGGATADESVVLNQVVVYDPLHAAHGTQPFTLLGAGLPHPTCRHTATRLLGADLEDPGDDCILVAGGRDGETWLGDLTLIRRTGEGRLLVEPLRDTLQIPRADHAAVAVGSNRLLVDGGKSFGQGGTGGLVEYAEVLTFHFEDPSQPPRVERQAFRTLARYRHSLTLLAGPNPEEPWVLAYGGFGRNRERTPRDPRLGLGDPLNGPPAADAFFPAEEASVLASPVLLNLSLPEASVERLRQLDDAFDLAWVRAQHSAVPFETEAAGGLEAATAVLIVAGTLRHESGGYKGSPMNLWELPRWGREILVDRASNASPAQQASMLEFLDGLRRGTKDLAQQAVLRPVVFRFNPVEPAASRLEVLPRAQAPGATPPSRIGSSAVRVPGLGVLVSGGEVADAQDEPRPLDSQELFLSQDAELREFSTKLSAGRSRHQALLLDTPSHEKLSQRSVLLVGGLGASGGDSFPHVEEVPLPVFRP